MRPHRLTVTAFGAFAGTEEVSFDDLDGLFLLHGETGAGKTTLLDAIAFALYGRVPGERGKAKRLRSDHAADGVRTQVRLEATIGGRRLRITRKPEQLRPKRSGTGVTKEQASVLLEESGPDGDWVVLSTRVGEADAEILDLMGMSADQFFQVVLLPQGQFAQFLHAGADARAELLQKLFGTDRFRSVEQWLAEQRRITTSAVASATENVSQLLARISQVAAVPVPDEPDGAVGPWQLAWLAGLLTEADTRLSEAAAVAVARKSDLDQAHAAQAEAEQLADRQRRRRDALRRQGDLQRDESAIADLRAEAEGAARAAEVAPFAEASDQAALTAEAARRDEGAARAAIPASHESLRTATSGELRAEQDEQRARLGRLDALRAVARQADDEQKAASDARARASSLEEAIAAGQDAIEGQRQERARLTAARDAARDAAQALPYAQEAAGTARRAADDSAALVREHAAWRQQHEAHVTARESAVTLREEASRIREARIDGMRAELAATLTDGAPCPVCGALDHPDPVEPTFEPVSQEREQEANERADQASAEADQAGRQVSATEAVIRELAQRLAASTAAPAMAAVTDPARLDALALEEAARQAAGEAGRLEAEESRLKAAAADLSRLQDAVDELDAAVAAAEREQAEFAEQRTAALESADSADQRAAQARHTLRAQLGDAPDLDTALAATRDLAEALAASADAVDTTERTATEAGSARDRANRAAAEAGFGDLDTARAAFREPAWRDQAAARIRQHEAETEAVTSLLADPELGVPLDPPAPVAERADATRRAQDAYEESVDVHSRAQGQADQLRLLQPQLEDALNTLAPLRERADQARRLADLAGGLGANQYKMTLSSFVLAARLEEVATAASQRLVTMTAGRYTLVHTDARKGGGRAGLGLLACDAWTGQDRDTSTLSGGETFLASLALALGLADVVTAESAGTPMEALFVDEGFGTLDEDTLEEVIAVLDGLREGGRIVGVVSHVSELRQRIPARVHVRKGHHGSHVSVTAG
jgi:exonuclease SbcC